MYTFQGLDSFLGKVIGSGQCVAFVQRACGCPQTALWTRGQPVKGATMLPAGTAIATFSDEGKYLNATDGSSHAAVYLGQDANGLQVIDAWLGQPVHKRTIQFRGGVGKKANDGDQFAVVE